MIPALIAILWLAMIPALYNAQRENRKYKKKIRSLKRKIKNEEVNMSKLIDSLVGKKCKLLEYGVINVLETDDEWIKFTYTDKRGETHTRIERVENLDSIEILEEKA